MLHTLKSLWLSFFRPSCRERHRHNFNLSISEPAADNNGRTHRCDSRLLCASPSDDLPPTRPRYQLICVILFFLSVSYTAGTAGLTLLIYQSRHNLMRDGGSVKALVIGYLFTLLFVECLWLVGRRQVLAWNARAEYIAIDKTKWEALVEERDRATRHLGQRLNEAFRQEEAAAKDFAVDEKQVTEDISWRTQAHSTKSAHSHTIKLLHTSESGGRLNNPLGNPHSKNSNVLHDVDPLGTLQRAACASDPDLAAKAIEQIPSLAQVGQQSACLSIRKPRSWDNTSSHRSLRLCRHDQSPWLPRAASAEYGSPVPQSKMSRRSGEGHHARVPSQRSYLSANPSDALPVRAGLVEETRSASMKFDARHDQNIGQSSQRFIEGRIVSASGLEQPSIEDRVCAKSTQGRLWRCMPSVQMDANVPARGFSQSTKTAPSHTSAPSNWTHKLDLNDSQQSIPVLPDCFDEDANSRQSPTFRGSIAAFDQADGSPAIRVSDKHKSSKFPVRLSSLVTGRVRSHTCTKSRASSPVGMASGTVVNAGALLSAESLASALRHGQLQGPSTRETRVAEWIGETLPQAASVTDPIQRSGKPVLSLLLAEPQVRDDASPVDAKSTGTKSRANISQAVGPPSALRTPLPGEELMWDDRRDKDSTAASPAYADARRDWERMRQRESAPRAPDDIYVHDERGAAVPLTRKTRRSTCSTFRTLGS